MKMGSKSVWVFLVLVLVSLEGRWSEGELCWDEERIALLQLKPFFNSTNNPFKNLKSWVEGEENSECCEWENVACNNITGRVIHLDLFHTRDWELGEWYINASLFSPFQQLEWLDLSFNQIAGFLENEGFERLSRLSNLEYLDLGDNIFNNSILSSLAGLSSLKTLYLYANNLKGTINIEGLSNLEYLELSGNMLNNSILSSLGSLSSLRILSMYDIGWKGSFDVEGLHSLSNLEELDLGDNEIYQFVIPKGYRGLKKLNILHLWNIKATNGSALLHSILESFPSLKTLYLGDNNFNRTVTTQDLHNLTSLEELILDYSKLHSNFLRTIATCTSLKRLSMMNSSLNEISNLQGSLNFKNLEHLLMDEATLNNNFFGQIIGPIPSLKVLSLSNCGLNGTLNEQGLCGMTHLQELHIDNNDLKGYLPPCFANLTSLQLLDISSNQITGDISSSPLKDLASIKVLNISDNSFHIPISLEPFYNLSKLKEFRSENNQIYVETMSHSLTPKFQLNSVTLSGYTDVATFPKFFYHQHDLHEVNLFRITLSGEFPHWLMENNTQLETLCLVNNSLSGPFPLPFHSNMHFKTLDISVNFFHGHIPPDIGTKLPRLKSLNISRNNFSGNIPSSFGDMKSLQILDLSNNQLSGSIPEHLAMGCFSLELLILSYNNLQGRIFSNNFNLTQLKMLKLDDNHFSGKIPERLSNCSYLGGLYLSDNHLSSKIPRWIGNLSYLSDIVMSNNHLESSLPLELCQLVTLQILDLSENNISGNLPHCFSQSSYITQIHLSKNRLQGQLHDAFWINISSLMILDLSYNQFKGIIPNWIDRLSSLGYLILAYNNIEGEVPIQLCKLSQLRLIDLSHNNLSGQILPCLGNTALNEEHGDDATFVPEFRSIDYYAYENIFPMGKEESIEFRTKRMSYSYKGGILTFMSGIDFSCNKLSGKIPHQIGNLTRIRTLNLSHNNLTGPIPISFSNLKQVESMDLSYNNLNGKIPPQLVKIDTLAVFSLAHNNLSGKTPERIRQFATFEEGSYEGNPFLCGPPLNRSCNTTESSSSRPGALTDIAEDSSFMDMDIFYISFTVSYIIVLLTIVTVLFVNPYWRQTWFYLVEMWMTSCYDFVVDHLPGFRH